MRQSILLLCTILLATLTPITSTHALTDQDLTQIQQAIRDQGARWEAGDNWVFRLSPEEMERMCGAILEDTEGTEHTGERPPVQVGRPAKFPTSLDWRNMEGTDYITPIRNQAGCGSCVSFGTIAAFEGLLNIYCGCLEIDLDLSEQHIFSCGGGDCEFGWDPDESCQYLLDYGAPPEWCLPYAAVDDNCDSTCFEWQEVARKIMTWDLVPMQTPQATVEEIKSRLMFGPVLGCFDVYEDFGSYVSGVYQHVWGELLAGHCISIVGWDDDHNCWICKNSWGPAWGEEGYFRIRMGTNETHIEEWVHWMIPQDGTVACVELAGYQVGDTTGNSDGIPDPGERLELVVTLQNRPTWSTLEGVTGWLLSDDPRAVVQDAMAMYSGTLPGGGTIANDEDPFAIALAESLGIAPISFTLWINGTCEGGTPYNREMFFHLPLTVPQNGWPAAVAGGVRCSPVMIWNRGGPRRLAVVGDGGTLHLWEANGQEAAGFPFVTSGGAIWGSLALADLDADGSEEILFGSRNDTLYAIHQDGSPLFKRDLGADVMATPAVADLESDGGLEIVVATMGAELCVLDAYGQDKGVFPVVLGGPAMADAALADLDEDGCLDVAVGATDGKLYAICGQTGQNLTGFPFATGGSITSSAVVADLNSDGRKDIVCGSDDGTLYAVTATGEVLFTRTTNGAIRSSPAIADLDGNGTPDVIFTSLDNKVYAVRNNGHLLQGWPYETYKVLWSSPIVVDIDGDGALEVVVEVPGMELLHLEADGSLALNIPLESNGIAMSSPVVGDLDNDGDLEIAVGTLPGVSVWNYPTDSDVQMPWPMYRGNPRRTGYVGDIITSRPQRPISPPVPGEYALEQNYPNPFNPETTIRYRLSEPGPVRLTVHNILGQKIVTLADQQQQAGQYSVVWDGLDAGGKGVSSGIYFCRLEAKEFVETRKMVLLR